MQTPTKTLRLLTEDQSRSTTNLVPQGAKLHGQLEANEGIALRIDGEFKGSIDMKDEGFVHIAAGASLDSERVVADFILIEGDVKGSVHARKGLEITKTARVKGDIRYDGDLDFHPGARITGQITGPEH